LTFAFHDKATVPGGLVRKILVDNVGIPFALGREAALEHHVPAAERVIA
jgi:hypothetical protein